MSPSDNFYVLLASLFQQTAQNLEVLAIMPLKHWPSKSEEERYLEALQAVLAVRQTGNRNHPPRVM